MSTADSMYLAAADDMRGRLVAVWHNAGHVRIEVGESPYRIDVDLSIEAARVIINGLADAVTDARLYELEQAAADTAEIEEIKEYRRP